MKPKIKIVDTPVGATAAEVEAMVNPPCEDGYYWGALIQNGLPEGIAMRVIFKLRAKPEEREY